VLADQATDAELREELKSPSGEVVVFSVPAVRELPVEDRFKGVGGCVDDGFFRDVEDSVCEGCDDLDARVS
jgi:uncharacterized protein (UPF0218 family)